VNGTLDPETNTIVESSVVVPSLVVDCPGRGVIQAFRLFFSEPETPDAIDLSPNK